jgi:hypothetical protein
VICVSDVEKNCKPSRLLEALSSQSVDRSTWPMPCKTQPERSTATKPTLDGKPTLGKVLWRLMARPTLTMKETNSTSTANLEEARNAFPSRFHAQQRLGGWAKELYPLGTRRLFRTSDDVVCDFMVAVQNNGEAGAADTWHFRMCNPADGDLNWDVGRTPEAGSLRFQSQLVLLSLVCSSKCRRVHPLASGVQLDSQHAGGSLRERSGLVAASEMGQLLG